MVGKSPDEVKSLTLMRETITLVRQILRGEDVVIGGRPTIVFGHRVSLPKAFQWPWGGFDYPRMSIPIYVGARGPRMIKLAGAVADGLICEHSISVPGIEKWTRAFSAAAVAAGRDPATLERIGLILFSPSESGRLAETLKQFLVHRIGTITDDQVVQLDFDPVRVRRVQSLWREGKPEEAGRLMTKEMVSAFGAVGTPDECIEKLRTYHEAGLTVPLLFPEACDLRLAIEVGAAYAAS